MGSAFNCVYRPNAATAAYTLSRARQGNGQTHNGSGSRYCACPCVCARTYIQEIYSRLPNSSSGGVVIQGPVAVEPLHDAVLHLHGYVAHHAEQLDGAVRLVVLVPQRLAHGVHYPHRRRCTEKETIGV